MILIDYLLLLISLLFLLISFFPQKKLKIFIIPSTIILFAWLLLRTIITHHAPMSNVFETIIMFTSIYLLKLSLSKTEIKKLFITKLPAVAFLIIALIFPLSYREPRVLPAILDSIWFYIHVPSCFISYVSLFFATVLSIQMLYSENKYTIKNIDWELRLSVYFMSIGLITGAFWADLSWSSFWNWDPKEIWALITWMLTVLSLHFNNKYIRAVWVMAAFISMLFTYFGVSYFFQGLHSYQ